MMCAVSLAGQWIEEARSRIAQGRQLRVYQALPCLCCHGLQMLHLLLLCRWGSVCVCMFVSSLAC